MIISASTDYREAARRKPPPSCSTTSTAAPMPVHAQAQTSRTWPASPCQRAENMAELDLSTLSCSARNWPLPLALAPVGLRTMYARRASTGSQRRATGIPFTLSTVSVCRSK